MLGAHLFDLTWSLNVGTYKMKSKFKPNQDSVWENLLIPDKGQLLVVVLRGFAYCDTYELLKGISQVKIEEKPLTLDF